MRELEERCRAQSEQFRLLSRDLHKFRQHAGQVDLLGGSPGGSADVPSTPSKPFPQLVNGLAPSIGAGECLRPGEKGWLVTPALTRGAQLVSGKQPVTPTRADIELACILLCSEPWRDVNKRVPGSVCRCCPEPHSTDGQG